MAYTPTLDRYDLAVLLTVLVLVVFGTVVYPHHIVQVVTMLVGFTIVLAWMAFFLWKWFFEGEW